MMLDVLGFFCVKLLAAWFPVLSDVVTGATVHARTNIEIRYVLDSLLAMDLVRILFHGIRDAHCTAREIRIIGPYFHCMSSFRHKPPMTLHPAHSVATHNPL